MTGPYRNLITAYDGSENGRACLALARRLARGTGAELLLAYVFPSVFPYGPRWQAYEESLRKQSIAEEMLAAARRELEPEISADTRVVSSSSAARGLHDLAEAEHADLIVLGSSHHGPIGRVLAGSVAEQLLHGAPCAVAVAPRGYAEQSEQWQTIVVGFDGSAESKLALAQASQLALDAGAVLRVIAAVQPIPYPAFAGAAGVVDPAEVTRDIRSHLEEDVGRAVEGLARELRAEPLVVAGDPAAVLEQEGESADLLVLGSRGYGPFARVLLGSVSARLVRSASCPVIVVPRGAGA